MTLNITTLPQRLLLNFEISSRTHTKRTKYYLEWGIGEKIPVGLIAKLSQVPESDPRNMTHITSKDQSFFVLPDTISCHTYISAAFHSSQSDFSLSQPRHHHTYPHRSTAV